MYLVKYYDKENNQEFLKEGDKLILDNTNNSKSVSINNLIPRFIVDTNYAGNWGYQWNKFRLTELDSKTGLNLSRERIERCLNYDLKKLKNKLVLELGCGAGRFTEILLEAGAKVVSVDISNAVDANAENFPVSDTHQIVQADINNLPFYPEQFDFVICLGVVQHTPNPEETIKNCIKACKKGGKIAFDQYVNSLYRRFNIGKLLRIFIKRIPSNGKRFDLIRKIVNFYYPIHASPYFQKKPLSFLLAILSPCGSFFRSLPSLDKETQYQFMLANTHDALTDIFKHLTNHKMMSNFLNKLPVKIERIEYGGNGIEVLISK